MPDDIEALYRLAHEVQDTSAMEDLLQHVVDRTAQMLNVVRVSAYLLDPSTTRLLASARAGLPIHRIPVDYKLGEGLVGWIAQQQQPIRVGDAEADPRFLPRPGVASRVGSFLGVPLLVRRSCIGVLSATHPEENHFSAHHERLLVITAGLCAPALEAARLARLAVLDDLTGAYNRSGLSFAISRAALRTDKADHLAVAALQIVHSEGDDEPVPDVTLRHAAQTALALVRSRDELVRYEREAFLLVMSGLEGEGAQKEAERIRDAVQAAGLSAHNARVEVGVADHLVPESWEETIARAFAQLPGRSGART